MRYPIGFIVVAAALALALVVAGGTLLINPPRPLIVSAEFEPSLISPNADGTDDITRFTYEISQSAWVSILFTADSGEVYSFRDRQPRDAGSYSVLFSGVVDGFILPDEDISGEVLRRLIPNGDYTWTLSVEPQDGGDVMQQQGTLTVQDGVGELPLITEFTVSPPIFTPNQDGVSDRTQINVVVNRDHETLTVYLLNEDNERLPIVRREEGRLVGEAGRHTYDYEGGVDIGADPPPDGLYTVVAELRDFEGQMTRQTSTLEIRDGGNPRAEIRGQSIGATVVFVAQPYEERYFSDVNQWGELIAVPDSPNDTSALPITMALGDVLVFKLTVENYGSTPIRTSGPPPGTVYQYEQRASTLGALEQSGVWRVGIDCETAADSYPWRWGLGDESTLTRVEDPVTGNTYLYLMPGEQVVVWGAIRMTEFNPLANPQGCWAGLIHEDVAITIRNNNVGRREIQILPVGDE
jgi:hypothetical protein